MPNLLFFTVLFLSIGYAAFRAGQTLTQARATAELRRLREQALDACVKQFRLGVAAGRFSQAVQHFQRKNRVL